MVERCRVDGWPGGNIAADDRGLAYGDGVFRTLRLNNGAPVAWAAQWSRLNHDCRALDLATPARDTLEDDLGALGAGLGAAIAKIMVTRGSSGRGYTPSPSAAARHIVTVHPADPAATPEALTLYRSSVALAEQPALAGIKHLNRLEQVWARRDCDQRQRPDALMCDSSGRVISTTMRNLLFADENGHWWTPRLARAGVAGATRQRLLDSRSERQTPVGVVDIDGSAVSSFTAAIACNSVGGAIAVTGIENHHFANSTYMAEQANTLLADTD